ncbi:MAG: hypothetical protein K6T65_07225 [Peptococcaceae bacterium]|nr:hypothetical protein [Peptococcaceae bacterium]
MKVAILFFAAVASGVWVSLEGMNQRLAAPVGALQIDRLGEREYRVEVLGERLVVFIPLQAKDLSGLPDLAGQYVSEKAFAAQNSILKVVRPGLVRMEQVMDRCRRILKGERQ